MGRYAKEAEWHVRKIKHYHDHAGSAGYSQAVRNFNKLSELMMCASRSKNDKDDAIIIQARIETVKPLMEEMNRKEEEMEGNDDKNE